VSSESEASSAGGTCGCAVKLLNDVNKLL
jgi:hypothetical protein